MATLGFLIDLNFNFKGDVMLISVSFYKKGVLVCYDTFNSDTAKVSVHRQESGLYGCDLHFVDRSVTILDSDRVVICGHGLNRPPTVIFDTKLLATDADELATDAGEPDPIPQEEDMGQPWTVGGSQTQPVEPYWDRIGRLEMHVEALKKVVKRQRQTIDDLANPSV